MKKIKIVTKTEALNIVETSYLASLSALLWVALYYLPIGGALLRLILPLPIILLHLRRGTKSAFEGLIIQFLLLFIIMGPVRGTLFLFPYGILAFWLGWCWYKVKNWGISFTFGVLIGTFGFFLRVFALSTLVGENLWLIITRASYGLIEKFIELINVPFSPSIRVIQCVAIFLIIFQEIVYVLTIHIVAYSLFPRLKSRIPDPPKILNSLVDLNY
tara:strand:+ start:101 stop:748 length:648 start_codon:yes stop_codon:yes gene_type:complete